MEQPKSSSSVTLLWEQLTSGPSLLGICGALSAVYLCWKHGVSLREIASLKPLWLCIELISKCYRYFVPQPLYCQVECYGQGKIHRNIMDKLNIIEKPGAPLVLFVYGVSRETEDLRNALQWIEGKVKRKVDLCAVILLEKCFDRQNLSMEVAHRGMFGANSVVVRIVWKFYQILECSNNKAAMAKVREKIMECQASPTGRRD